MITKFYTWADKNESRETLSEFEWFETFGEAYEEYEASDEVEEVTIFEINVRPIATVKKIEE